MKIDIRALVALHTRRDRSLCRKGSNYKRCLGTLTWTKQHAFENLKKTKNQTKTVWICRISRPLFPKRTACVSRSNHSRLSILVSLSSTDPWHCIQYWSLVLSSMCQSEREHRWPWPWLVDLCGQISHTKTDEKLMR